MGDKIYSDAALYPGQLYVAVATKTPKALSDKGDGSLEDLSSDSRRDDTLVATLYLLNVA